jgi:hypothetical protein
MSAIEMDAPVTRTSHSIEWAPFRLADGIDETTLLAASEALQREFISQQPGFIRRELLKGQANQWADIIYWDSLSAAEEASHKAMHSPVCHTYFALMLGADPENLAVGVSHFEQVQIYV